MKIKDIFYTVCELCGNSALADSVKKLEIKKDDADIKKMFNCYNLVVSELSEEFVPLTHKETLSSLDGKYYFSSFSKSPKEIKKVFVNGKETEFKVFLDYVSINASEAEIIYEYVAKNADNLEEFTEYSGVIPGRILALGVASEYLLVCGLYKEAIMYRDKFEKALLALRQKKNMKMRARRWA